MAYGMAGRVWRNNWVGIESWIMEGKACKGSGVDLNEMMRYEERIPLDLRLRDNGS